jgi:hypothetical protein
VRYSTHSCCEDRPIIQQAFTAAMSAASMYRSTQLQEEARSASIAILPLLQLPTQATRLTKATGELHDRAVASLLQDTRGACESRGLPVAVGIDIIWDTTVLGCHTVSALQLASISGMAVSFSCKNGTDGISAVLRELLQNQLVTKIGFNTTADNKLLQKCTKIVAQPAVQISEHAARYVAAEQRGDSCPSSMSASLVLHRLPAITIRGTLAVTDTVVQQSCLEAYAAVRLHEAIRAQMDPVHKPAPTLGDLDAGTRVLLYGRSITTCIAEGIVVAYDKPKFGSTGIPVAVADDSAHTAAPVKQTRQTALARSRVVIELTAIKIGIAYMAHPSEDNKKHTLQEVGVGSKQLRNIVSIIMISPKCYTIINH